MGIRMDTFNGNLLGWQEFWDIFNSTIHQQSLSNVKFSYLKSSLRGAATSAVSGISVTDGNYPIAIALLKEKFGRKEAIVEALYSLSQLQILPISQKRFSDVKFTYDAIEKILRQLESQTEDINRQRIIVQ